MISSFPLLLIKYFLKATGCFMTEKYPFQNRPKQDQKLPKKKVMTYNCQARTPRRESSRRLCQEVFWKPSSAECRTPSPACWSTPRWECQESLSKVGWFPPFLCRNQIWHTRKTSCTPGKEILWSNGTLLSHLIALFNILNDRGVLVLCDAGGLILGLAYLQSLQLGLPAYLADSGHVEIYGDKCHQSSIIAKLMKI